MNLRFSIPIPPSLNNIYVNVTRGGKTFRVKAPSYKKWIEDAGWHIRSAQAQWDSAQWEMCKKLQSGLGYSLVVEVPAGMQGDVDNRVKAASDLLKAMSIVGDDKQALSTEGRREESVPKGWGRIFVYPNMREAA